MILITAIKFGIYIVSSLSLILLDNTFVLKVFFTKVGQSQGPIEIASGIQCEIEIKVF